MMQTQYPSASLSPARRSLLQRLRRGAAGFALLAAAAFAGAACSSEEPVGLDGAGSGASGSGVPAYVSLRLTAPSSAAEKRANPAGGETGDGSETGQTNENAIRTVTAFFYPSTDFFADANDDPNMIMVQFGEDQITEISSSAPMAEKAYQTAAVDVDLEPGSYHVLAIVNGGEEVEGWTQGTLGLDRLRKRARTSAWTVTAGDNGAAPEYSDFVMSSAEEASITIEESNSSAEHPATAEISVERLAARVDYCPVNDFDVEDKTGTVTITGLALANNLTRGEYYFKRVTEGGAVSGNVYLGDEEADPSTGAGLNYVRDPWTDLKTEGNKDAANFPLDPEAQTTSKSYASDLYASGHYFPTDCQNNAAFWSANAVQGTALPAAAGEDTYYLAAYTMENTLPKDAPLEYYATAAVFKAIFQPAGLTADGGNYKYKEGDTFFEWNGALYLDLADIMDTYNEGGVFAASQADLVSATTWDDVRQILGTLTQADPTGYYEWLSGQITAATAESTPQPAALTWDHYMLETFGYSRVAGSGATIDQDSHDTQAELLAKGDIRTYRHSECYYTWFIKHAEDGDEAQGVMEYGIVRNNIYKLKVNSVKGLGSIVPDEDNQLRVSVYVRNWRLLPEESLAL